MCIRDSSWDPALGEEIGKALGEETASYSVNVILGPGLNTKRSPLCGRNFEYYSVTSNLPQPQKLSFSPNPHNKIGLYFGWRWIFLGWSVDVDDIYRKTNRRNKGTEFDLSLYSSKLGVDIFYRRTGNNYKIHKINGFPEDVPANYSEKFNGIKVDIKGLNLYLSLIHI